MPSTSAGPRLRSARPMAVALAAVLVLSGCAGGNEIQNGGADDRFISGDGSSTVFEGADRVEVPEVSGTSLDGDEIALSDYLGEIVVLNVWASWCGPCRAEQPVLDEVHAEYADLGVDFLGVNIKDDETAAQAYAEHQEIPYPSLYDQPGEIPQAFRDTVPPRSIPSTLIIDPEGRIAARVIGPTTYGQLTDLLNPVVVEFDLGDPEERPRVAEQEAAETDGEADPEASEGAGEPQETGEPAEGAGDDANAGDGGGNGDSD
ncbi:TlpA family protein disulfide reductase [Nocardiopsis aegyptia]|uniref:Thiol-disulfide isomerase/thioredoxin n=1 Tax=Nocardiopsis aegyptia TaxID=220378 RepID=A0A7Z0ENJ5_9ACTN|nr:TlpA disulfide reductase family protein [Nocardiopsis aegyptia]NYJ34558.1 thiol-disulfide isomerase/thioredoxin [Nocardiopsis aegyptia]